MRTTISLYGFTSAEPEEDVQQFLEQWLGEGTVLGIVVAQPKSEGSRTWAKVQFINSEVAETVKSLAAQRLLWYGDSYLKARDVYPDIASMQKQHKLDGVTLHFGCQIAKERFSALWKRENVSVTFGLGQRKFYFFLSFLNNHKLELSYDNIWQIELHCPRGQTKKFLRIQLLGGPKIFTKDIDDHWIREVDFSTSCRIGQSSDLCLELPRGAQLPNLQDNFVYFKESEGPFFLETGSPFCLNTDLVPVVSAPKGFELPYEILFKVNSLVQHGCIPGPELDEKFYRLIDRRRIKIAYIQHALERLCNLKERCYDPVRWLSEQYRTYLASKRVPASPIAPLEDGLVYVHRVQITPTKVYFCGPEVNLSNRVLRKYSADINNFLRVSFVDEDLDRLYSTNISPRTASANEGRRTKIYRRILSTLRNGIFIGSKHFEFLGFSHSQLRDSSLWMFASRPGLTAEDIRKWMGDFREIRNVARYAARLGQSFGSSRETFNIPRHEREIIPDIEVERDGIKYVFSDGIGKISEAVAHSIARKMGFTSYTPSAFQIRYGGYKGVVAVDPRSKIKLSLRKSMCKYKSDNTSLDVLGWSKYQPCFLNREVITLLSTLGVRDDVFERKQKLVIAQLDAVLTDPLSAQETLGLMAPGETTNILKELLMCGYKPDAEPFLAMMLQAFRAAKLFDLQTRTRIFVPKGRVMMGCLDETGTLRYGQVFVQYSRPRYQQMYEDSFPTYRESESGQFTHICEGKIVVAKNPCLHPGDVRVLKAVDVPALRHMVDCIVFPQKGKRPHTNECSGSDLDGDVYFVCWDPDVIPPEQCQPMDYRAAESIILDHDVTIKEVQEHFTDYILNDNLGIICHAHTVFADREPSMAKCDQCIELSRLSSIAVDFPKTGVPAKVPKHLRVEEYPDFMEKTNKRTYESKRVIGKLYRAVKGIAPDASPVKSFTEEVARSYYDRDMEVDGFKDYISEAFFYKSEYDSRLGNMLDYFGINTEAELLSGFIMKVGKSFDKRRDMDTIMYAVRGLRKQARDWFNESNHDSYAYPDELLAKASAWYHVTYHHGFYGRYNEGLNRDQFISFPWCVYDKLIEIKKRKAHDGQASHSPFLEHMTDMIRMLSVHAETYDSDLMDPSFYAWEDF